MASRSTESSKGAPLALSDAQLDALANALGPRLAQAMAQPTHQPSPVADSDRYWALKGLQSRLDAAGQRGDAAGGVLFVGDVRLPSGANYVWQEGHSDASVLNRDWSEASHGISALAHPVRLKLLRACIDQARSTQDLMALPDMGTTGQLFHHLKALQQAGWLRSLQRGSYQVPGERVVPLLVILAACLG
jgi:Helix-turn-helix domain